MSSTVAKSPGNAGPSGYAVGRPVGRCAVRGTEILPGDAFMAVLKDTPAGLQRSDISLEAWTEDESTNAVAYWRAVMPKPDAVKRKPFVDDDVLLQLFERLAEADEPHKVHFRFVLGLVLMRKRRLAYEASDHIDGHDVWIVRRRGSDTRTALRNPHLTEQQVTAVSTQLGQILNEDL